MDLLNELIHLVLSLLGKKQKIVGSVSVIPKNKEVKAMIDDIKADASKASDKTAVVLNPAKPLTKEQRVRRILDLLLDSELAQGFIGNRSLMVNVIHPDFQPYIISVGAAYAGQKTQEKLQRLNKDKGYLYAEWYMYEALSAQWRKQYASLISQAGQLAKNSNGSSVFRANLHELFRQTLWADRKYCDEFLFKNNISDDNLTEFLLALADDSIEFLPKADKPR